ncbi:MAG: aminotransferase class IV [Aestuariivirga sp.]
MTVWCNGNFVEGLNLDVAERGLMLGDGIFETIAVRNGRSIWLEEHLQRLQSSAKELGLKHDLAEIRAALGAVLIKSSAPSEVLRLTLTRGPTQRGLAAEGETPSLIISLNPFDLSKLPKSVRLATSSIRRNATSPASQLKTLSYIDGITAAREVATHADDALMLNTDGNVASTTIANIFLLKDKRLITPSNDQAILMGIARGKLISGIAELGLQIETRPVKYEELRAADAVFLTNSLRLSTAVSTIDGTPCGGRDIGFIHTFLSTAP